jgi:hypothetical protein
MVETEESIYNLIPKEEEAINKPPLHQSKFKEASKELITKSPAKKPHATMGPLKVEKKEPTQFIKKHTKDFDKSKPGIYYRNLYPNYRAYQTTVPKFTREPPSTQKKQVVPKRTEKPVMGQKTQKDFVKTNVLETTALSMSHFISL